MNLRNTLLFEIDDRLIVGDPWGGSHVLNRGYLQPKNALISPVHVREMRCESRLWLT